MLSILIIKGVGHYSMFKTDKQLDLETKIESLKSLNSKKVIN